MIDFTTYESATMCFMQSQFWKALAKGCGWEINMIYHMCFTCGDSEGDWINKGFCRKCGKEQEPFEKLTSKWLYHALAFHELNLVEGKDKAVEYLSNLVEGEV